MKRARLAAWLLLLASAAIPAEAAPSRRESLSALLRAVDSADPGLAGGPLEAKDGEPAAPALDGLFAQAANSPADLATGFVLSGAAEAWMRRTEAGGGGWSALLGKSSGAQRTAARSVIALAAASVAVLDRAVEAADRAADNGQPAPDPELVERALHTRQVILPLRASRCAVYLASSSASAEQRRALGALALDLALRVEPVSAWSECERLLMSAWALTLIDKPQEATAAFEKARRGIESPGLPAEVSDRMFTDCSLGTAAALLAHRGPVTARESLERDLKNPRCVVRDPDSLERALAAVDLLFRVTDAEAAALQDVGARNSALSRPWRELERLVESLEPGLRWNAQVHCGERLTAASGFSALPDSARVAFAARALVDSPPRHEAAQRVLAPIADPAVPPVDALHRDAFRLFCRAGSMSEDPVVLERAARAAFTLLACCADDPAIGEALASAAHAAETRLRRSVIADDRDASRRDLLEALRALAMQPIQMEEPLRDPWRLTLGRTLLAMIPGTAWPQAQEYAIESRTVLSAMTSDESIAAGAILLAGTWSALLRVLEEADDEEAPIERIAEQLLAMCDPARAPAAARDSSSLAIGRAHALLVQRRFVEALAIAGPLSNEPRAAEVAIAAAVRLGDLQTARSLAGESPAAARMLADLSHREWKRIEPATHAFFERDGRGASGLSPLFRLAAEFAADPSQAAMQRARSAWAMLLEGEAANAGEAFAESLTSDPASASLRRGLGEALLMQGQEERGFAAFSEIARAFEARQEFTSDYWHAWTRMLEILARRPRTSDEDARLRREIARLRSLDSALEHPAAMVRLKAIEEALDRE